MSQGGSGASGIGAGAQSMPSATGSRGAATLAAGMGADRTPRAALRSFPSSTTEDRQPESTDRVARDDLQNMGAGGAGGGELVAGASAAVGSGPAEASPSNPHVGSSSTVPPALARRHAQQGSAASSAGSSGGSQSHQPNKQSRPGPAHAAGTAIQQQGGGQRGRPGHPYRSGSKASDGSFTRPGKAQEPTNCSFCLLAEFDIDKGSTLAYQYPEPTGHDSHMLAELMLPDGAHARHEDWTVFFLKPPDPDADQKKMHQSAFDDYDQDDDQAIGRSVPGSRNKAEPVPTEDLTFVLNLVRTKHDNTVRRGAMVKAMCVGTRHPYIQVFKPLLLVALDRYYQDQGPEHLERLYEAINSLDLSGMPVFTREEKLVLRASDRRDLWEERFTRSSNATSSAIASSAASIADEADQGPGDGRPAAPGRTQSEASMTGPRSNAEQLSSPVSMDDAPATMSFPLASASSQSTNSRGRKKDTRFFSTLAYFNKLPIPLHIPLTVFPEEIGEYSMIQLVQTFSGHASTPIGPIHPHLHSNGILTHPIILLFNAMATQKRVIFLGHGQAAHHVASHVLAASALGSGCGVVFNGFAGRVFPYTNLTNLDELETVQGYIAGVTNPRFEDLNAWDVLFNTENGKVTINKNIEPAPPMQQNPRPPLARTDSFSSRSISSVSGSNGIGHIAASSGNKDSDAARSGSKIVSQVEAQADAADNIFMEDVVAAIVAHCGEDYVRQRFVEHAQNFARIVARHEEHFYGHTSIGPTSQPFLNGQLGSGALPYGDRGTELRDIQVNAMRAEGWRGSYSYKLYREDEARRAQNRSIVGFDCPYQIGRLRRSKTLATGESDMIFEAISRGAQTNDQVTELLSLLPSHSGGLSPLAFGVLHPSPSVRASVVDLFMTISTHSVGVKLMQGLNTFLRLALGRALHQRAEMPTRWKGEAGGGGVWQSPTPTLGGSSATFGGVESTSTVNGGLAQAPYSRDGLPGGGDGGPTTLSSVGMMHKGHWANLYPPPSLGTSRSVSPASGI